MRIDIACTDAACQAPVLCACVYALKLTCVHVKQYYGGPRADSLGPISVYSSSNHHELLLVLFVELICSLGKVLRMGCAA